MHMLSLLILIKLHGSAITTHRLIKMTEQSKNQCTLRRQCTGINGWDHALPLQHCGELNSAQSMPPSMRPRRTTVITHMCTVQTNSVLQMDFINLNRYGCTPVHKPASMWMPVRFGPRAAWLHPRGWEKVHLHKNELIIHKTLHSCIDVRTVYFCHAR